MSQWKDSHQGPGHQVRELAATERLQGGLECSCGHSLWFPVRPIPFIKVPIDLVVREPQRDKER